MRSGREILSPIFHRECHEPPFAVFTGVRAIRQTFAAGQRDGVKRGISALLGALPAEKVRVAPNALTARENRTRRGWATGSV
jgi:hypothetical protein